MPRPFFRAGLCTFACAWLLTAGPVLSKTIAGVELPSLVQTEDGVLGLAMCGVRKTLWIEHYVTAVYVPRGESVRAVRDPRRPKALRLQVIESRYLPDEIPAKWRHALERNLRPQAMARVRAAFRALADGDVLTIVYTPRRGFILRTNGRVLVQSRGHGVIDAILTAWAEGKSTLGELERLQAEHPC